MHMRNEVHSEESAPRTLLREMQDARGVREMVSSKQGTAHCECWRKKGALADAFISEHAITEYQRAIHRVPRQRAIAEIRAHLINAHFVKMKPSGAEYWRSEPPLRLRWHIDPARNASRSIVMTVIVGCEAAKHQLSRDIHRDALAMLEAFKVVDR